MSKKKRPGDRRPRVITRSNKATGITILVPGRLAGAVAHSGQTFTVEGERGFDAEATFVWGSHYFKLVPRAFNKEVVEGKLRHLFPNEAVTAEIMERWHAGGNSSVIVDFSELARAVREIRTHHNRPSFAHRPVHALSYQRLINHARPDGTILGLARELIT